MKTYGHVVAVAILLSAHLAAGQVIDQLMLSIPAPFGSGRDSGNLGYSVAASGNYIVVGAPYYETAAEDGGVVKIFSASTGALMFVLRNPSPTGFRSFGFAVAVSGTRVVVGASIPTYGVPSPGRAYVFDLNGTTPTVPILTLNRPGRGRG